MSDKSTSTLTLEQRMDRLPITRTHVKVYLGHGFGQLFDGYDVTIIGVALAAMIPALHLNFADVGYVSLANNIGLLLGALLFGTIADYIGRKDAFQVTVLIFGIGSALTALSSNLTQLIAVRLFTGFGLGGELPLVFSIIGEWTPKNHRGKMLVITGSLFGIGISTATGVAAFLFPTYGWQIGFWIGAIPAVLFFVIRFFIPDSPRSLIARGKAKEAQRLIEKIEKHAGLAPTPKALYFAPPPKKKVKWTTLFSTRYRRTTIAIWCALFLMFWSYWGLTFLFPSMLSNVLGFTLKDALYLIFLGSLPSLVYSPFMGWLWDWLGRKTMLTIYMIAMGISIILIPFAAGIFISMLALQFVTQFGSGGVSGLQLYTSELYDTDVRSTGTGAANALGRFATAISPAIGGLMLAAKWPVMQVTLVLGIPALLAFPFLMLTKETKRQSLESVSRKQDELQKVLEVGQ